MNTPANDRQYTPHGYRPTAAHVHRRGDWRPCPATMPPPLQPTKPTAIWFYRWAEAIQHLETFEAFVAEVRR